LNHNLVESYLVATVATERERGELLGRLREKTALADEARQEIAALVQEARRANIAYDDIENATRLSEAWLKRLAQLGYWPERGRRAQQGNVP